MNKPTTIFDQIEEMGHEQVMFFNDNETGLKGIIGIHNTTLGPALGGTRVWRYENEQSLCSNHGSFCFGSMST